MVAYICGFTLAFALVCRKREPFAGRTQTSDRGSGNRSLRVRKHFAGLPVALSSPPLRATLLFRVRCRCSVGVRFKVSRLSRLLHWQTPENYRQLCFLYSQHILAVYRARAQPCLNCGELGTLSEDEQKCLCDPGTFGPTCAKPTWTPWSTWSACSVSCGEGTIQRTRQCDAPEGYACPDGTSIEEEPCDAGSCASEWSDWSSCSVSCSARTSGTVMRGAQSRGRNCLDDASCQGVITKKSRDCSKACPIACPTANPFEECSGHGDCRLTPEQGCTQAATCRCATFAKFQ